MPPRFVQIHTLTAYPASLLNRDDAGFAKRISFGGSSRTRISSQCLKRHWRTHTGAHSLASLGVPGSIRSRRTFDKFLLQPLVQDGVDPEIARAIAEAWMAQVLGQSPKAKKEKGDKKVDGKTDGAEAPPLETDQVTVVGRAEIEWILAQSRLICSHVKSPSAAMAAVKEHLGREGKSNLAAMVRACGLDAALFGRMVTGDVLSQGDAAIHVAHAFTVHEEESESDYFAAVDDLFDAGDALGSGHIGTSELTAGLFYGYVVVDIPLLVSNLEGVRPEDWLKADRTLAVRVLDSLLHLVTKVSPGAKLGSTAPYAHALLVAVELGDEQPRTLANAFLAPVAERPDLRQNTYEALASHVRDLDQMYGPMTERRVAATGPKDVVASAFGATPADSLESIATWLGSSIKG